MSDKFSIPIHPLSANVMPRLVVAPVLARMPAKVPLVAYHVPAPNDDSRWKSHAIGGRTFQIALHAWIADAL